MLSGHVEYHKNMTYDLKCGIKSVFVILIVWSFLYWSTQHQEGEYIRILYYLYGVSHTII